MLTPVWMAARGFVFAILMAVFFSPCTQAGDGSLYDFELNLNDLIYDLSRSVVTVEASHAVPAGRVGSRGDDVLESEISSGIVVDTLGHILVAAEAVLERERIIVKYNDRVTSARLLAVDYQTETALLESRQPGGRPVRFSSMHTCAGQMVVAIGNSFGMRSAPSLGFCAGVRDDGMMQFSVPVPSGAVGGGVFDLSGDLLGVITGGLGQETSVTMALPGHCIPRILGHLLTEGDRQSGFVGITTQEIEISPGIQLSYPNSLAAASTSAIDVIERAVVVTSVVPSSPAQRAGLALGDLIFAFDDVAVNSAAGLASLVRQTPPGRRVAVELIRQNQHQVLSLDIGHKGMQNMSSTGTVRVDAAYNEPDLADSIRVVIRQMKDDIIRLERQLDRLD